MRKVTADEWRAEGVRLYGDDKMNWRFKCPSCGHVASVQDWKDAGASAGQVGFSCIGRNTGSTKEIFDKTGGPCNYAGGGLFALNPVEVDDGEYKHSMFEFADHQEGHAAEGELMEAEARQ